MKVSRKNIPTINLRDTGNIFKSQNADFIVKIKPVQKKPLSINDFLYVYSH